MDRKKLYIVVICLLFLTAVSTRIYFYREFVRSPYYHDPILDGKFYHLQALDIASGKGAGDTAFFMSPLYPYFVAGIYILGGTDANLVRIIQAVMGLGTMLLFFLVVRNLFSPKAVVAALIMFAGYPLFLFFESQFLHATILTFLLTGLLYFMVLYKKYPKPHFALYAGIVSGLLVAGRGTFLVFLPVLLFHIYRVHGGSKKIRPMMFACIGCLVIILPITLRNFIVGKEPVFLTTNSGLNFFIGNNPMSQGGYIMLNTVDPERDPMGKKFAESQVNRTLTQKEISRFWKNLAIEQFTKRKLHYVNLYFKKAGLFFSGFEIPQLENFYYYKDNITPVLRYLPVSFAIISPLAIAGIFLSMYYRRDLLPYLLLLITNVIILSFFFISSRYRLPFIPIFIIFAAFTVERFIELAQTRKFMVPVIIVVCVAGLYFLLNRNVPKELDYSTMEYNLGVIMKDRGDYNAAVQHFKRVKPESYAYAEALYAAGVCYQHAGHIEQARDIYIESAKLLSKRPEVFYNLGVVYDLLREPDKAIESYRKSIELDPKHFRSYNNLGTVYLKTGKYETAREHFLKSIELNEWYLRAYLNLGQVYILQRDIDSSEKIYMEVMNRFPDRPEGYQNYGIILLEKEEYDEAVTMVEKALERDPQNNVIRQLLEEIHQHVANQ